MCRIIEIAGGREVFCQSRSKALRKSRSEDKMAANRCKSKSPAHPGGVWELRTRLVTPLSSSLLLLLRSTPFKFVFSVGTNKNIGAQSFF